MAKNLPCDRKLQFSGNFLEEPVVDDVRIQGVPLREENTGSSGLVKGDPSLRVTSCSMRCKGKPTVRRSALLITVPRVLR
jgi:hypothetical protein